MSDKAGLTRRQLLGGAAMAAGALACPGVLRAQSGSILIGHLTPRTGFLGPLGDYAVMAVDLAVEHINARGGVLGRRIEVIEEDSVNPQTAATKAERMLEGSKVAAIVGEISSASALAISQVVERAGSLYINTGANADSLRGADCKRHMFHVETQNVMYVNAEGQHFLGQGLVKGKNWYLLSADYAFGHDLRKCGLAFLEREGGKVVGDDLVPTDNTDFSSYLLKIREANPDLVVLNLAGTQITSFFKQYGEFGLEQPLGGFGFDTAMAWAAGVENFRGTWPCVWNHQIDTEGSKAFTKAFTDKYGKPPENQAWGDYVAMHILAKAFADTGSTDPKAVIDYLEKAGTEFDLLKARKGYFNPHTHQLMQDIYAITALPAAEAKNQWDIFSTTGPVPPAGQSLDVLLQGAIGGECKFPA